MLRVSRSEELSEQRKVVAVFLAAELAVIHESDPKPVLYCSNKSRGMRKKAGTDYIVPSIAPEELASKEFRRGWARPIQKICEVDQVFGQRHDPVDKL